MTSNDVPARGAGASGGRRRALGRGPGTAPVSVPGPVAPEPEPELDLEPEVAEVPEAPEVFAVPEVPEVSEVPEAVVPEPELPAVVPDTEPEPVPDPGPGAEPEPPAPQDGTEAGDGGDDGGVFKVRLANFEGPFDLLLQLISKHKLDVTEVALSKVTDEFMAHIRAMGPDWDLDETTEFLVVAATLLDLKAARLLPSAEVEDEADLALLEARDLLFARLLQYRAYKQIADIFNRRLDEEARRYPRTVGLEPHHAELLPEVVISIGAEGFARLAVKAMQPKPKPQVYVDHIHAPLVSVQEQAGIVVARLKELGEVSFQALVEDTDDTLTVVARFLALLELYREKAVALDQETALGELLVRWTGGEGDEAPMVTDEFDRPPEPPKREEKKA
ncbi:ScpA family protein [Streptomyces sp. Tu102]|uniref:segregation and condensation protein A n=1 Tax=Streptomyces sp. Tu102 TaxID=2838019 RepID=UPI001BDBCA28|nr:segregation/condensation protein A [Streptomyces sp. Tu102]MBT1096300.1 segregation/condensation protein A [Streptomyces sp. Tu102]